MNTTTMAAPPQSSRLLSLDAFRGATIGAMMLVNNPGSWSHIYPQLDHAKWNGWTFTDWIFPFFLFIVGVAMTLSFAKRLEVVQQKSKLYPQVFKRSAIIFAVGLFLNGFPFGLLFGHQFDPGTMRIPGVLQRIALCYLFTSLIVLNTTIRGQVNWILVLLAGYWLAVKLIPVPGYGAGVLEPLGSLCWYVDSTVLSGHTWSGAPVAGFDPEGIVSTIPAIATTLFGVLTGHFLRSSFSKADKTAWMFVMGNILLLVGAIMDMGLPINKNMWTSSYSIFMAGWALVCLAVFYWLIDVKGYTRWAQPLIIWGMNAIAMFVLSGVVGRLLSLIKVTQSDGTVIGLKTFFVDTFYAPLCSPINASLLYAITFMLFTLFVAWLMWKRKWFWKV